jgi:hypothetical protein
VFEGALKYQCRPCECSRRHEYVSKGCVLIKVVRVPKEVVGVPKEAVRVQHSPGLYNTLTTVRKFYYKPREYM